MSKLTRWSSGVSWNPHSSPCVPCGQPAKLRSVIVLLQDHTRGNQWLRLWVSLDIPLCISLVNHTSGGIGVHGTHEAFMV